MPTPLNPVTTLADISVPYKRMMNSTTANIDESGVTARASFLVKRPQDAWQFVRDVAGSIRNLGGPGSPMLYRVPLQFPENPNLYANGASITYGGAQQWAAGTYTYSGPSGLGPSPYGYARVDVNFKFYAWGFQDAQWSTYQMRSSGNFITTPYQVYLFADGRRTDADVGILVPEQEMVYTRYWLPDLSYIEPTVLAMSGCVNSAPFGPRALDSGTVLFIGGDSNQTQSVMGIQSQDVQLTFRYRRIPWNNFLHPDGVSGFQPIADGAGNPPFPGADINQLTQI
jgi:hypothetical protein